MSSESAIFNLSILETANISPPICVLLIFNVQASAKLSPF